MPAASNNTKIQKGAVSNAKKEESLSGDAKIVYDKCIKVDTPVTQDDIVSFLPIGRKNVESVSNVINNLLSRRLLEALHQGTSLVYRAISHNEARRIGDMDGDESMIYQYIKAAGDEGIWSRHIKARTNLHATVITRNLKTLESKSLIKCVRSVQNPTRKIYMLYEVTPSIEVSGGPWFTDSELDTEFVEQLSGAIEKFVQSKTDPKGPDSERIYPASHADFPTIETIHRWLQNSKLTDVALGVSDINALLEVLIYDGKVEKRSDGLTYKTVSRMIDDAAPTAFTEMPCGQCPVFNLCQEGGIVSPESCVYWQDWLDRNL